MAMRYFGSGASDMKSGLAVMIALVETLGPEARCVATSRSSFTRAEEPFAENELGAVLEQDDDLKTIDLAICLEPSDNKLHLGCCGAIHAQVTYSGRTAHSARPWEGDNAVVKAAGLLDRLAKLEPVPTEIDGYVYKTVTTVTLANGGRGRNVVPDSFVLNLNHRFVPTTSIEKAKRDILDLVGSDGAPNVEFTDVSPAAMPSASHPLVQKLIDAGVRGVEPKQAWTDVARFSALGIPAINFGPGENAQAHQKNESTSLALLHDGYAITARWLLGIS